MPKIDWRWINSFVLVVEHGGLSAAANASELSQPTLSRHIKALEEYYGSPLVRFAGGLTVTRLGEKVIKKAQIMAISAGDIESLTENENTLFGSVRLSVSPAIAQHILPFALGSIPNALGSLEVIIEGGPSDILRKESDIAIRLFRPTQLELKTKKLGEIKYGVFVHNKLVPDQKTVSAKDLIRDKVNFVGVVTPNPRERKVLESLNLDQKSFQLSCDSPSWRITAVQSGLGAGVMPEYVAQQNSDLVRVLGIEIPVTQEVWLTTSQQSYSSKTTRSFYKLLGARISSIIDSTLD